MASSKNLNLPAVGLSTLYLLLFKQGFERVLLDIQSQRDAEQKPDIWELVDEGDHSLTKERLRLLQPLLSTGARFSVHGSYESVNIANLNRDRRKTTLSRLQASIDSAASLEATAIVVHPGWSLPEEAAEARRINNDSLALLQDYASSHGVDLAVENMIPPSERYSQSYFLTTPSEFFELAKSSGLKVKIAFDPGHAQLGALVREFISKLSSQFHLVHSSDNMGGYDDHLALGKGSIDWKYIVSTLKKQNFQGCYIVESVYDPFDSVARLRKLVSIGMELLSA